MAVGAQDVALGYLNENLGPSELFVYRLGDCKQLSRRVAVMKVQACWMILVTFDALKGALDSGQLCPDACLSVKMELPMLV
jgi:hypothetical protein